MKRIHKRAVGRQKNLYFWTFHMRGVCWIPHGWGEEIYFLCFWWFLACAVPLVSWAGRSEGRWSEGAGEVAEAVVEVRGWMVSWHMDRKWEPPHSIYRAQFTQYQPVPQFTLTQNEHSFTRNLSTLLLQTTLRKVASELFSSIPHSQGLLMHSLMATMGISSLPCFTLRLFVWSLLYRTLSVRFPTACLTPKLSYILFFSIHYELFSGKLHSWDLILS